MGTALLVDLPRPLVDLIPGEEQYIGIDLLDILDQICARNVAAMTGAVKE